MPISPVLGWFLAGIVLFVVELILPGFVIFFFGIGAWCTALILSFADLPLSTQLLTFLSTSLATLFVLRSALTSIFLGQSHDEDDSVTQVPRGATGIVTADIIPPREGKVKYGGTFWRARAHERIHVNTPVQIIDQHDLVVTVSPLTAPEEKK